MKRLNITDGVGHPFTQDDLGWLAQMCLQGGNDGGRILRASGSYSDIIIVAGGNLSGTGTISVSAGWALVGTEICEIPAHTFTDDMYRFWYAEEVAVGGSTTYEDGSSHQVTTQKQVKMIAVASGTPPGGQSVASTDVVDSGWQSLALSNNYSNVTGAPAQYRRRLKNLEFRGQIAKTNSTVKAYAFAIPGSYVSPGGDTYMLCSLADVVIETGVASIDTTNHVKFFPASDAVTEASGQIYHLTGLRLSV